MANDARPEAWRLLKHRVRVMLACSFVALALPFWAAIESSLHGADTWIVVAFVAIAAFAFAGYMASIATALAASRVDRLCSERGKQ